MGARALSDLLESVGVPQTVGGRLKQHGVKGMKWGQRKPRGSGPGPASKAKPPKRFEKAPPKSVKKMSDQELSKILKRMQMEKQLAELSKPQVSAGKKWITDTLVNVGKQQATALASRGAEMAVRGMLTSIAAKSGPTTASVLAGLAKR